MSGNAMNTHTIQTTSKQHQAFSVMTINSILDQTKQVVCFADTAKIPTLCSQIAVSLASTTLSLETIKHFRRSLCSTIALATRLPVNDFTMRDYSTRRRLAIQLILTLGHSPGRYGIPLFSFESI